MAEKIATSICFAGRDGEDAPPGFSLPPSPHPPCSAPTEPFINHHCGGVLLMAGFFQDAINYSPASQSF